MNKSTNDSVIELVHSLKPMIKTIQKKHKQYLLQLEPIVKDAIASKNQDDNYLGCLLDSLSDMAQFSRVGIELYHELLNYIDSFNPKLAQWYRESDEEINGI